MYMDIMTRKRIVLQLSLQAWFFVVACHAGFASSGNSNLNNRVPKSMIPDLTRDVASKVFSRRLNFRVAVVKDNKKETPFQMKDMIIELTSNQRISNKRFSTGIHEANLLQNPYYINDEGQQQVSLTQGGWEITWKENSPHGHLTCSFVSPNQVQRNSKQEDEGEGEGVGAILEAGRFFMNHRVWTPETLELERERRRKIQLEAAKYIDDRDKKIRKMTDENETFGSKVMSYAQAAKSMDSYRNSGYKEALYIPLYDEQVLQLAPDFLILSTRGEVFKLGNNNDRRRGGLPEKIGDCRVDDLKN